VVFRRFGSNTLSFLAPFLTGHWEQAGEFRDGLIVGGVVAAPLAGWMVKALQERTLLRFVGFLITLCSWPAIRRSN
jgi:hypothetical protein